MRRCHEPLLTLVTGTRRFVSNEVRVPRREKTLEIGYRILLEGSRAVLVRGFRTINFANEDSIEGGVEIHCIGRRYPIMMARIALVNSSAA